MTDRNDGDLTSETGLASETRLTSQTGSTLPRLVALMQRLLGPDGCPWDREQTLDSLRSYVIEEAFEVVDAIDKGEPESLREELGDLLLQIVFQSELARAAGWFGPDDVVAAICDKLERRHPHVFGDATVDDAQAALRSWEVLKARERGHRGALAGVPVALPALLRAVRVGEKATAVGYDWNDAAGVRAKVDEELTELDDALREADLARAGEELGDVLFALSSLARKHQLDPEAALRGSLDRFSERFNLAEREALARGTTLREMNDEERDALWEIVKRSPSPV